MLRFQTILPLSALAVALCACSHDDTNVLNYPKSQTFADKTLELYYNGNPMTGKRVTLGMAEGDKGTITMDSEFNLSQLGMDVTVPSSGVIPGSAVVTLPVSLSAAGDSRQFAGDGETDFVRFAYEGYLHGDVLKLFINDARLKSGGITPEVWKPAQFNNKESDASGPVYIEWQYDPIPGIDLDLTPLVNALADIPLVPVYGGVAYSSLNETIDQVLKTVAFLPDGNVVITSSLNSYGTEQPVQNRLNSIQYVLEPGCKVRLFIEPMSVLGGALTLTSGGTSPEYIDLTGTGLYPTDKTIEAKELNPFQKAMVTNLVKWAVPQLSQGFELNYAADNGLEIFVDEEEMLDMAQSVLLPALQDDESVRALVEEISKLPEIKPILPDVKKALALLPQYLERTTKFRMGIRLTK